MADQQYKVAQQTYGGFLGMIRGGAIAVALVGLLVLFLIS